MFGILKLKMNRIGFFKKQDIYQITRIVGFQDNILGVTFDDKNNSGDNIEVIEWDLPCIDKSRNKTSQEEVLEQVRSGLKLVNQSLGTNYQLSRIYFSPFDISTNRIYSGLIVTLIIHYHTGKEFEEL